jgi:hypothetical protein
MFLAIIFVCFTSLECGFMVSPVITSESLCNSVVRQNIVELRQKQDVTRISAACIEISENKGEI